MRWRPGKMSDSIEDRRSSSPSSGAGMSGMPIPIPRGKAGLVVIVVVVLFMALGGSDLLRGAGGGGLPGDDPFKGFPATPTEPRAGSDVPGAPDPDAELVKFVSFTLDDIQGSWERGFASTGKRYERARLVLFRNAVQSGCGGASSAAGPFYCPLDRKVYLDLGFFRDLAQRFRAPGDFAQAYVIAHEIGHHVQTLLGVNSAVRRASEDDPSRRNDLSVRQELQADCLAGVWAHGTYERGILESGDLEEGLGAAAAVGDDRIQRETSGQVNPESFTHGTSQQRTTWFRRGFDSGDPESCDTFSEQI